MTLAEELAALHAWLNRDSKTFNMKTVPYLHSSLNERQVPGNDKVEPNKNINKEIIRSAPEFADLINLNSPFRFMKIHTSLMEREGIFINDIAVIDTCQIPQNGKIVVVKIDDTLMIRKYEKVKNGFLLHLNGQNISPLKIESGYENVEIIGVVTFVIKSM